MLNFKQYPMSGVEIFVGELNKAIEDKKIEFNVSPAIEKYSAVTHAQSAWYALKNPFPRSLNGKDFFYVQNSLYVYSTNLLPSFPLLHSFLKKFARQQRGLLRRVSIVGLRAEGEVLPHVDHGTYFARTDRYHLVLISPYGSEFFSGDEHAILKEGELWWFDNKKRHSVKNLSDALRVHVIFDLLPKNKISFLERIKLYFFEFCFQSLHTEGDDKLFLKVIGKYPALIKIITA